MSKKLIIISTSIALLFYILNWTTFAWIFLLPISFLLAKKTNNSLRQLKKWWGWLLLLTVQLLFLFIFEFSFRNINWFLNLLADLFLLYFLFQLGEIIWNTFKRSTDKTKKSSKIFSRPIVIILGILVFVLVMVNHSQKIKKITDNILSKTSPAPLEITISCQDEVSQMFSSNRESFNEKFFSKKEYEWKKTKYTGYVYNCDNYDQVFILTKNLNKDEKIIFSLPNKSNMSIMGSELKDINRDGLAELIIKYNNGDCPTCNGLNVYQLVGEEFKNVLPKSNLSYTLTGDIIDINNDGIYKIEAIDDIQKYNNYFNNVINPVHIKILSWKDNHYVESSGDFKKYYQDKIKLQTEYLNKLMTKLNDFKTQEIMTISVMNYLDYMEIGQKDFGYDNFWNTTDISKWSKRIILTETDKEMVNSVREKIQKLYQSSNTTELFY